MPPYIVWLGEYKNIKKKDISTSLDVEWYVFRNHCVLGGVERRGNGVDGVVYVYAIHFCVFRDIISVQYQMEIFLFNVNLLLLLST